MSAEAFAHTFPWTEEEYLALGETLDRVELFDGSLLVSPAPTPAHQELSAELRSVLKPAARLAGLRVYEAVNVRLKSGRITIPDLVVVDPVDPSASVVDALAVRLICEIVSPSNAGTDRVLKRHYYAEAGIEWYLLVEQDPELALALLRLETGGYVEHAVGRPGRPLRLVEPVAVEIDPGTLTD
jgi:Uma2 family endonuclease